MRMTVTTSLFLLAVTAASAAADATYDLGVRVGGYGFKREGDSRPGEGWSECRMNGVGVFATRGLRGPLFVEGGLDAYSSADAPLGGNARDLPIDRMSGLVSAAIGARTAVTSWLRGYVQVGGGVELTKVSVPYGELQTLRDSKVMPEGFFGVGLDLRIAHGTYLGASFRTLVMGNFAYDPALLAKMDEWSFGAPDKAKVFDASADLAAQGQFYVRHDL